MKPTWLTSEDVLALHDEAVAEFGGLSGIRDAALLESAIVKPVNLLAYGHNPGLFELAAAYCVGIAKNHPFVDGNKRTAFLATAAFLELNGYDLEPPEVEVVETMLQVAQGLLDRRRLAKWLAAAARRRAQGAHR